MSNTVQFQRQNGKMQQKQNKKQKPKAKKLGQIDIPLLTITLLILLFGLVMLFSASYPSGYMRRGDSFAFIGDQLRFAIMGLVGMAMASLVDYRILKKYAWPVMAVALILLVIVLFMPEKNGAKRWIYLGPNQSRGFQPSEIVKFALIMVFAKMIFVNQSKIRSFKYGFLPFMLFLGTVSGLLVLEPHLSCTILVIGIGISMMFAGGTSIRYFFGAGALVMGGLFLVLKFNLVPYAMSRIDTWRDPLSADPSKAYQIVQSLIAVGSGGPFGLGPGRSVQKFLHLPEVYNDYIYAIVCEELGMIGGIAVMILFIAFLIRSIYIALHVKDKFGSMLIVGVSVQIALQAFLHIAVNLNAIPSTGISLPFFSYGGTSLCMLLGQVGVVLSVSRKAEYAQVEVQEQEEEAPSQTDTISQGVV